MRFIYHQPAYVFISVTCDMKVMVKSCYFNKSTTAAQSPVTTTLMLLVYQLPSHANILTITANSLVLLRFNRNISVFTANYSLIFMLLYSFITISTSFYIIFLLQNFE